MFGGSASRRCRTHIMSRVDSLVSPLTSLLACEMRSNDWQALWAVVPHYYDGKVNGANMGPIWGWQAPGGPHLGPINFAIWVYGILLMEHGSTRQNRMVWCYANFITLWALHQRWNLYLFFTCCWGQWEVSAALGVWCWLCAGNCNWFWEPVK